MGGGVTNNRKKEGEGGGMFIVLKIHLLNPATETRTMHDSFQNIIFENEIIICVFQIT